MSVTTAPTPPLETIELSDEEASVASPRPARALPLLDDNRADQATEGQIWVRNPLSALAQT